MRAMITFLVSFTVFGVGYYLNDQSRQNIFTIIAVLIILPAAKMLVGFIVMAPFHSVSKAAYDEVSNYKKENDILYSDMVFTSTDKIMNLSFLMVKGEKIYAFSEHKKGDVRYMKEYLQRLIDGRRLSYQVNICKDFKEYLHILKSNEQDHSGEKDRGELHNMIMSILV
jgi:flagellar motor component MotA